MKMKKSVFEQKYLNKNVIVELKNDDRVFKGKLITGKEVWEKYYVPMQYYWVFDEDLNVLYNYGFKFSHVKKIRLVEEAKK